MFSMVLIAEVPVGTCFSFFFFWDVYFSYGSYSRFRVLAFFFFVFGYILFLWLFFLLYFCIYIFPMVLLVECPVGTGFFFFPFFFF